MKKSKGDDFERIVSSSAALKAKELAQKLQTKSEQEASAKADAKEPSVFLPGSKKIKKEPIRPRNEKKELKQKIKKIPKHKLPKVKPADAEQPKAYVEPLDEKKYYEFVHTENAKYMRIRKRTIEMIKLDKDQLKKATRSLISHFEKSRSEAQQFNYRDDIIFLEITLNKPFMNYRVRPIQIKLPIPVYDASGKTKACVITTDPEKTFKNKLLDIQVPSFSKILGLSQLKKNYPKMEDRKKLVDTFDMFFCHPKVYNFFRQPIGSIFHQKKKIPFPIDCENTPSFLKDKYPTYEKYLNSLTGFSYFSVGKGPTHLLKVARISMGMKDIVKNIIHGIYNTIPHLLKEAAKHTSIKQICIKTSTSISLPVFNEMSEEELSALIEEARAGEEERNVREWAEMENGMEEEFAE